jgi:hypothetical protein
MAFVLSGRLFNSLPTGGVFIVSELSTTAATFLSGSCTEELSANAVGSRAEGHKPLP